MTRLNRRLWVENLESRRLLAAVNMPQNLTGAPGTQISVPVLVDTAAGIRGAEINIQYDPLVLSLNSSNILAGSVWNGDDEPQVVANINQATGSVLVFISAAESLTNIAGSLLNFNFGVLSSASVGASTVVDFVSISLNEGTIPVNPSPIPGADPTDGRITIVAGPVDPEEPGDADRISGFVFADTNNNNLPDSLEGVPGVTITLTNVATGATTQATTESSGFYEFTQLVSGTYRIVQTQPLAYLEGGPNELNVQLAEEQALENQNFRELGLRPEFVYNRFHTTLVQPVGSPAWISLLLQVNEDASQDNTALSSVIPSTVVADSSSENLLESLTNEGESLAFMHPPLSIRSEDSLPSSPVPNVSSKSTLSQSIESSYQFDEWLTPIETEGNWPTTSALVVAYDTSDVPAPVVDYEKPREENESLELDALDQVFANYD